MKRPLRQWLNRLKDTHNYGWVLLLTVVLVILTIALPDTNTTRVILTILTGANLIVAAVVSEARPAVVRIALLLVVVGVTTSTVAVLGAGDSGGITSMARAVLVLATPLVMLRGMGRAMRETGITSKVILGALTFYLLIGLFFGLVYGVIAHLGAGPLFEAGQGDGSVSSRLYFAFTTQTTVGYGDYAPQNPIARAMAVSQALIGQLYLVTVLALLVGNIGRKPQMPGRDDPAT